MELGVVEVPLSLFAGTKTVGRQNAFSWGFMPLLQEGKSRLRSFLLAQATGLVEPVAALLGALLVSLVQSLLPWALSFAAGAMVLVAAHELIPACRENETAKQREAEGSAFVNTGRT